MNTSSTEVPAVITAAADSTTALINGFLNKPVIRSKQSIQDRMTHWADVANQPAMYLKDGKSGPDAERQRRKVAVQSLRKLVEKYPGIAQELQRESNPQEAR